MPKTKAIEVRVVFDAAERHRGRAGRTITQRRTPSSSVCITMGLLNLLVAGTAYYAIWWKVDRSVIYPKLILNTPLPGVDLNEIARFLSGGRTAAAAAKRPPATAAQAGNARRIESRTRREATTFVAVAYGWLALATLGALAVALSGGSMIGAVKGAEWRRVAAFLGIATLVGVAIYLTRAARDDAKLRPHDIRSLVGVSVAFAGMVGVALARAVCGLGRLGGVALIVGGVGSAVGLLLWVEQGALSAAYAKPVVVASIFAAHSAWGWVLLLVSGRLLGRPAGLGH